MPRLSGSTRCLFRVPIVLALALAACADPGPRGLREATPTGGPTILWNLQGKPVPKLPLPNNVATRIDPASPTGRRVTLSLDSPTAREREIREQANHLTGFSVLGTISVGFDRPIDPAPFVTHHWPPNRDFADDLVYLVNVDPLSPRFGSTVPLDFGQGNFPITIDSDRGAGGGEPPFGIFENDTRRTSDNLLFETVDEDVNCNGLLDPGEDTDFDGILDKPNILRDPALPLCDPAARSEAAADQLFTAGCHIVAYEARADRCAPVCYPEDCLITHYEIETDTLLFRPIVPLDQETTYAVVLTNRITAPDGSPISSPFPFINHVSQTPDLRSLERLTEEGRLNGLTTGDIAFTWTFTTQSVTRDMETIREGLYGHGPLDWLAERYAADIHLDPVFTASSGRSNLYLMPGETLRSLFELYGGEVLSAYMGATENEATELLAILLGGFKFTDYLIVGTVRTPYFLTDTDGIAEPSPDPNRNPTYPADDDETFDLNPATGRATVGENLVTFVCFVPKEHAGFFPPFPLAFHSHGYTSNRIESFGFAGAMNRLGLAYCGVDSVGHGQGSMSAEDEKILRTLLGGLHLTPFLDNLLLKGRARDLNNDGSLDSGADFFTTDLFRTRDIVRQTGVDYFQLVRMFRGWDGTRRMMDLDGDGVGEIAGDFNLDGIVDFGGPMERADGAGARYYMDGCSLGGIVTGFVMGYEPAFTAGSANSSVAILSDTSLRTIQSGVVEAVYLPTLGPIVSGVPAAGSPGQTEVRFVALNVNERLTLPFLTTDAFQPGDRLELHNLVNREWSWAVVSPEGRFRLAVPADSMNATEKRYRLGLLGKSRPPETIPDLNGDEPLLFGDGLELRLCAIAGDSERFDAARPCTNITRRFQTVERAFEFQGARYAEGSRLAAIYAGFGMRRNSTRLREFISIAQAIIDPGDPAAAAPHYFLDPLHFPYDPEAQKDPVQRVLVMPVAGDMNTPVNTSLHLARAAGIIDLGYESGGRRFAYQGLNDRTENDVLLDHHVAEGVDRLRRFARAPWDDARAILFDPDDLDAGRDQWSAQGTGRTGAQLDAPDLQDEGIPPLRITRDLADVRPGTGGLSGVRVLYVDPQGSHCFSPAYPSRPFDVGTYASQLMARFFQSGGTEIVDDPCLADSSCTFHPPVP